ncbi:hypothetical protein HPB47_012250 [Ixodes persulcatus]|uniref:Uncharacterized protein n=1 Tax=Ixodes persulcatus TaxID=34615 RepID=A0AC60NU31_IXOPE|nr:hypothetical protein HPB47_012250 [Ixodes persulcatus]
MREAKLRPQKADSKIRVNEQQNILVASTVAYCYVCHRTGHRADVCPYPPDVPTCKDCEALLIAERHECKPKCSLCSGLPWALSAARQPAKRTDDDRQAEVENFLWPVRGPLIKTFHRPLPTFAPGQETPQFEVPVSLQDPRKDAEHPERIETQQSTQVSSAQTPCRKARSPPHLGEYLGSDHAILATTTYGAEYNVKLGKARLADWTKLRDER